MSISRHSVELKQVTLDRYYPPTTEKLSEAHKDIGFFATHQDVDASLAGLRDISMVLQRAGLMTIDQPFTEAYEQASERARNLRDELSAQQQFVQGQK